MTTQTKVKASAPFEKEGVINGVHYGTLRLDPGADSDRPRPVSGYSQFPAVPALASGDPEGSFLDNYHRPVLDIDWDAALIQSGTPGHHHLIIDKPMTGEHYLLLLATLCEVGLIEKGYLDASINQGFTAIALKPWKNQHKKED